MNGKKSNWLFIMKLANRKYHHSIQTIFIVHFIESVYENEEKKMLLLGKHTHTQIEIDTTYITKMLWNLFYFHIYIYIIIELKYKYVYSSELKSFLFNFSSVECSVKPFQIKSIQCWRAVWKRNPTSFQLCVNLIPFFFFSSFVTSFPSAPNSRTLIQDKTKNPFGCCYLY